MERPSNIIDNKLRLGVVDDKREQLAIYNYIKHLEIQRYRLSKDLEALKGDTSSMIDKTRRNKWID